MRTITIRVSDELHSRLAAKARATGRSIAAVVREKLSEPETGHGRTVFDQASDLAGILVGGDRAGTNERTAFRRG